MKATIRSRHATGESGSILATAVVMLAIASVAVGSILTATMTYQRNSDSNFHHEKASFLADAGLRAALVELNASADGNISYNQSRTYFSGTDAFTASDWGFHTQLRVTNGASFATSTGRYGGRTVEVSAEVWLGSGARSIHALYEHAMFAGNSSGSTNYTLQIGGTGSGADFVRGDVYSGMNIAVTGDSILRLPEAFTLDYRNDGIFDPATDTWASAFATQVFTNPLTQAAFNTYSNSQAANMSRVYNNMRYDVGEAFVDTIGNGVYDVGEPFVDANRNGVWDAGDAFIDRNGNGVFNAGIDTVVDFGNGRYDAGEEWTEDVSRPQRMNGRYDPAGGFFNSSGQWRTSFTSGGRTISAASWPAEQFEDVGDGVFQPGETYTDQNGVFDRGEQFLDDRNPIYDHGTQASGTITGMQAPGPGQRASTGGYTQINPPNLARMYYHLDRDGAEPDDALARWGNDVTVTASDFGSFSVVTDTTQPEHIFVRNPPTSGSISSRGRTITGRSYPIVLDNNGNRVNDFFLEDPTDPTYNTIPGESFSIARNDNNRTHTMMINVRPAANDKVYFVDGNVYIHNPHVFAMRFRQPGTRITIVARGNITISDEFFYNAQYDPNLQYANMNSTVVNNPSDALGLIALRNPSVANSGNIFIGDGQFGTGGSIHAMMYAENNFVDNNINTTDQQFISIFGNMTAGNHIALNRQVGSGRFRTRLDVTLDERIRDGLISFPGLPHAVGSQRSIQVDTAWRVVPGTWESWSMLQ